MILLDPLWRKIAALAKVVDVETNFGKTVIVAYSSETNNYYLYNDVAPHFRHTGWADAAGGGANIFGFYVVGVIDNYDTNGAINNSLVSLSMSYNAPMDADYDDPQIKFDRGNIFLARMVDKLGACDPGYVIKDTFTKSYQERISAQQYATVFASGNFIA